MDQQQIKTVNQINCLAVCVQRNREIHVLYIVCGFLAETLTAYLPNINVVTV